jgi:hypothetical protein
VTASRILVVEGTSGIGKSTLLDALARKYVGARPPRKLRTLLHLTQSHTYGPLAPDEDRGTLTPARSRGHLDEVVSLLGWHARAIAAASEPRFFALVDTLHLTHAHRPGALQLADAADAEERLAAIGAKLLFVHADADTIWRRGILPRSEQPFITRYARRFGSSLEAIHRYFVDEQAAMRAELARTRLLHHELAIDGPLDTYVEEAYDFWLR